MKREGWENGVFLGGWLEVQESPVVIYTAEWSLDSFVSGNGWWEGWFLFNP